VRLAADATTGSRIRAIVASPPAAALLGTPVAAGGEMHPDARNRCSLRHRLRRDPAGVVSVHMSVTNDPVILGAVVVGLFVIVANVGRWVAERLHGRR
jgi:hypothetical protein